MWYKDYQNVRFVRLLMGHAIVITLSHTGKTLIVQPIDVYMSMIAMSM